MDNKKIIIVGVALVVALIGIYFYQTKYRTYSVVFNTQMGAGYQTQEVKVGNKATNPGTPSQEGYIFEGWYLDDEKYNFDTPVTQDIIITAHWEKTLEEE